MEFTDRVFELLERMEAMMQTEMQTENEQRWTNYYMHCGVLWNDDWSCQCNDECPVCHAEIEPYASTDNESNGELQIHNQARYDEALEIDGRDS